MFDVKRGNLSTNLEHERAGKGKQYNDTNQYKRLQTWGMTIFITRLQKLNSLQSSKATEVPALDAQRAS
jgi:hypothetical protein